MYSVTTQPIMRERKNKHKDIHRVKYKGGGYSKIKDDESTIFIFFHVKFNYYVLLVLKKFILLFNQIFVFIRFLK